MQIAHRLRTPDEQYRAKEMLRLYYDAFLRTDDFTMKVQHESAPAGMRMDYLVNVTKCMIKHDVAHQLYSYKSGGAPVHLVDALMALVPDGVLRGKGANVLFRTTILSLSARIATLRDDPAIWTALALRHLPALRGKQGRKRRMSIEYLTEISKTAAAGQAIDANSLEVSVRLWNTQNVPQRGSMAAVVEAEPVCFELDEDTQEGAEPGPKAKPKKVRSYTDY